MSYKYRVLLIPRAEEDGPGWIAEVAELPGAMGVGTTAEEALRSLEDSIESWIEDARLDGEDIPEAIPADHEYSGKFTLRIPRSLHRQLAMQAKSEGVSLNQHIIYLVSGNTQRSTERPATTKNVFTLTARKLPGLPLVGIRQSDRWFPDEEPVVIQWPAKETEIHERYV